MSRTISNILILFYSSVFCHKIRKSHEISVCLLKSSGLPVSLWSILSQGETTRDNSIQTSSKELKGAFKFSKKQQSAVLHPIMGAPVISLSGLTKCVLTNYSLQDLNLTYVIVCVNGSFPLNESETTDTIR